MKQNTYDYSDSMKVLNWISIHLPKNSLIASSNPSFTYHHTNRKSVPILDWSPLAKIFYPHEFSWDSASFKSSHLLLLLKNRDLFWKEWNKMGVTHVRIDRNELEYPDNVALNYIMNKYGGKLKPIFVKPRSALYEILSDSETEKQLNRIRSIQKTSPFQ